MTRRVCHVTLLVLALAGCATTPAVAPPAPEMLDQAALLSAGCSGCHAAGGQSIVALDRMPASELEARLRHYRQDDGGGTAMHRMARGYSDEQIRLIATRLGVVQ